MILAGLALASLSLASRVKMSAWLVFYDGGGSLASFESHAADLDTVSADWIQCDRNGAVSRRPNPTPEQKAQLLSIARKNHVRVLATASNADDQGFAAEGVEKALASPDAMQAHADALVKIVADEGLDGLDLDYESLQAKDRDAFSQFVAILGKTCHAHRLTLALALHPKETEPGTWDGPQAQDYAALGRAADLVRVMTYDFHWTTSEAGPIAPPDWAERVARFAASVIPPKKLELGIPGYGYNWVGKQATDLGWSDFRALTAVHGAPTRDPSQELTLAYESHTVFFADGVAAKPKFDLAQTLGLHGVALWRLGTEDPKTWAVFEGMKE